MSFEVMSRDPETRVKVAIDDIRAGKMVILMDIDHLVDSDAQFSEVGEEAAVADADHA